MENINNRTTELLQVQSLIREDVKETFPSTAGSLATSNDVKHINH